MLWWLKKLKICITKNSNGEDMKKKLYKFELIRKLLKHFLSFFIGTNVYKKHKI